MKRLIGVLLSLVLVVTLFMPTELSSVKAATKMSVKYAVHVQSYGDSQGWVSDGAMAGTSNEAKRLESIRIQLTGNEYSGSVEYKTHVQSYGWLDWVKDGAASGTTGQAKRLEGIEIYLTGEVADYYDITYRVHCQTHGWMPWVSNGEMAGTSGESKRLEAIEIKLVPKSKINNMGVSYRTHCQTYGWLPWSSNGSVNGTTGESKRLEAIEIKLTGNKYSGGIQYRTHVQSYGWEEKMVSNKALSGTLGKAKRLEAIEIKLFGEIAEYYDVYYRVHAQSYGWLGWAKNGETSGTSNLSKRLESIQIELVEKGADTSKYANGDKLSYIVGKDEDKASTANQADAQRLVDLCNQERAAIGLTNMLVLDDNLTRVANIRAKEIAQKFDHTRPNGQSFSSVLRENGITYYMTGENIAAGYFTPESVFSGWMGSAGHRSNILHTGYNKIGIGIYKDPNTTYRIYWVQIFTN